jgi:hypothetical protein
MKTKNIPPLNTSPKNREKAQSLVELAISLVFMLTLVAGLIDIGRAFFTYIALRDAAQEGAAFASIARENQTDGMVCNSIITRAQGTSDTQIVDLNQTQVNISFDGVDCASASNTNACFGKAVEVYVTYPAFPLSVPFLGTVLGSQTIPIQASIIDTVLTPPCN